MRRLRTLAPLAAIAALLAPAAAAATPASLPPETDTLTAKRTFGGTCSDRAVAGRAGVARTVYRAPMAGFATVRLAARGGDWDLALFDAATGRRLASSAAFGATEVAQTWIGAGQRLIVQGCRTRGGSEAAEVTTRFLDVAPPRSTTPSLVRVPYPSEAIHTFLEREGFDITHNERADYVDVVVPDVSKLALLERAGIPYDVRVRDLNADYAQSRIADARYAASVRSSPLPTGRTGYRRFEDYQNELKQITDPAGPYASIARPLVIGHSFQGREIQGVELAADVAAKDDGRPVYFLMALHHAREWPSGETAMEFAWMLAKGYGTDPEITDLLRKQRVVIVPIINPDGFFASRAAASDGMFPDPADTTGAPFGDTVEGVVLPFGGNLAYRRKNCNGPVPAAGGRERDFPCYYQWGVDPNRNYGEGWGGPGASPDPNTQVYRGADQWSEPETQAVHEYSQKHPVTTLISLHNVAALVLRPPGRGNAGKAPDENRMKALGDAMATATGYESQYSFQLYDTSGTTEDWNYAAAGTFGYTIEIGPKNGKFHMPYQTGVVNEWVGPLADPDEPNGPRLGGLREALLIAARSTANPADHSVLAGQAPGGHVLRLRREFETKSSPVCTFAQGYVRAGTVPLLDCIAPGEVRSKADHLEYTTTVPASGDFEWHVTPSTRPFVGGRYIEGAPTARTIEFKGAGTGQPPAVGQTIEHEFEVTADDSARNLDLRFEQAAKPEDYDVFLNYITPKGKRRRIGQGHFVDGVLVWTAPGSGTNPPGMGEHITLTNPPVGRYVVEVENVSGPTNQWTLTVNLTGQRLGHSESTGRTEAYTLTCERPDGTVVKSQTVTVARGERLELGDAACAVPPPTTRPRVRPLPGKPRRPIPPPQR
jgi:hypothetical protein